MSTGVPLHFQRVHVRRMPGVDSDFALDELSPGINVVYGPNGCGKSRTAAAINTLLWPGAADRASLSASARADGHDWRIELDAGAVRYQRDGADSGPPQLPGADARDRYNLPLHDLLHDDSDDFAQIILRESAGGYDVKAAAEVLDARPTPSIPRKESEALKAAARELKDAEDAHRNLFEEAKRLEELDAASAAAQRAAGRADLLRRTLKYRDAKDAADVAQAALMRFPNGVGKLRGDELQLVARLRADLRDAQAARDKAADERRAAEDDRQRSSPGGQQVANDVLHSVAARQLRLQKLRDALDAKARERRGADAERDKARGRIAPEISDEQLRQIQTAGADELAQLAQQVGQARAQQQAHDEMAQWLGKPAPASDLDRASYALRLLWRWLQSPPPVAAPEADSRTRLLPAAAAVVIAIEAILLAVAVHWSLALFALAAVAVFFLGRRPAAPATGDARALTAAEFARLGVPGPSQWTVDDVAAAADRIAQQLAAQRVDAEKAARWEALAPRRERAETDAKQLEVRRQFIAARFGVLPEPDELALVALASNVAQWQSADARAAAAAAEYDATVGQYDQELHAAAELLRPFGYDVRDVAHVTAAAESLRDRQKKFEVAAERCQAATKGIAAAERLIESARTLALELYGRLGLESPDEEVLRRWCEQRKAYEAARQDTERAAADLRAAEAALPPDAAPLRAAPREQLQRELEEAQERSARAAELNDQAVQIRTRVEDAKKAANVEQALSNHAERLADLAARREEDCGAVAAWVLADFLRSDARDRHRPAVFHRARDLFARVTQGHYRLDFDDADPPSFRATDTSTGAGQGLDELSSGTRLQLLLAVRVAFVEGQEQGSMLPILLDEALANSDEQRARAIIDATVAIARSGRQVFYFTAQQDEVAKWKGILDAAGDVPHRLIDLAEVRGLAATERLPLREIPPLPQPKVPEPVGLSREQYAALLQVPAFDPSRTEVGGTHLWHLIEDPAVLHGFLKWGINTWGQLKTLGSLSGDALVNGSAAAFDGAAAAAKALEALAEAWRVGRGRPVDRQALVDSGFVSDRFIDSVCELAASVDHDAGRLLGALDDGKVKGFRRDAITNLRNYFTEQGHIDNRPPLSAEQIRARMLAAVAEEIRRGTFDARRVARYLADCAHV